MTLRMLLNRLDRIGCEIGLSASTIKVVSINTTFRHNTVVFDVLVELPDGTQRSLLSDKPDVLKAIFDTVRVRERYRADSWERQWIRWEWWRV